MVYAEFGGQTECIMGNWKIENRQIDRQIDSLYFKTVSIIHKNNFGEFLLVKNTSTTAKVRKIDLS